MFPIIASFVLFGIIRLKRSNRDIVHEARKLGKFAMEIFQSLGFSSANVCSFDNPFGCSSSNDTEEKTESRNSFANKARELNQQKGLVVTF